MKRVLPDLGAVAFLAALALFYHWPELAGQGVAVFVDSSRLFFPFWKWAASVWREGWLPLWNPLLGAGQPFLADPQTASTYPPLILLYAVLPSVKAFSWLQFLHHAGALTGFYVLARRRSLDIPPSLFGACVFGFSLHVVCMSWTPVALFAVAWMPWAFAVWDRLQGTGRGGTVLAAVLALQASAGYPVLYYLTVFAIIAEAVGVPGKRATWRLWAPGLAGAAVLSVILNAVWLLPFLEFMSGTDLGAGKYYQPLGFRDLLTLVSPFALGHPLEKGYTGPHYWVATYFMGIPAVAVAVWGAATGRVRRSLLWLLLLYLCLSLGETAFLAWVLKRVVPGYAYVIRSGFLLSLVVLYGGLVCAEALQEAPREGKRVRTIWTWAAVGAVLYAAAAVLGRADMRFLAAGALLFLLAGGAGMTARFRGWRAPAVLAALLVSTIPPALGLRFLMPTSYYESLPVLLSEMNQPGRFFHSPLALKRSGILTGRTPEEAYYRAKEWMYPNWPLAFGKAHIQGYNTLLWTPVRDWVDSALRVSPTFTAKALRYLGVRYLLGKSHLPGMVPVPGAVGGVESFEDPGALPLWFSVTRAYPGGVASVDMERNAESFFDFSQGCFVEDARLAGPYVPCRVTVLDRTPNRVELLAQGAPSTSKPEAGKILVVSSETAYPGWVFKDDWGAKKPLVTVNHVFRGFVLDPGEMHARITFEPVSFRLGLFLSLLSLGLILALSLRPSRAAP